MFGHLKGPALAVLEDFDNYFHGRMPVDKKMKMSFDVLLNVVDGLYSTHKGIVFCMTANDIKHIDDALLCRPSRFQFVQEVGLPEPDLLKEFLPEVDADSVCGLNFDQIMQLVEKESN
jgi:ATP-dependent 26S proteasome regulatory subunit